MTMRKIELNLPESWDSVTLDKFMRIRDAGDNIVEVLAVLADKPVDEVMSYPMEIVQTAMGRMEFLTVSPYSDRPSPSIVIDGETYSVNITEKLKTGEFVAADSVLKNNKDDYASLLAILCRKDGEVYDSVFEAEKFDERREMFLRQPITAILPVTAFFLRFWSLSETLSLLYSAVEEAASHTQRLIESSTRIGALRRLYMRRRMRNLIKSMKSNRPTLLIS